MDWASETGNRPLVLVLVLGLGQGRAEGRRGGREERKLFHPGKYPGSFMGSWDSSRGPPLSPVGKDGLVLACRMRMLSGHCQCIVRLLDLEDGQSLIETPRNHHGSISSVQAANTYILRSTCSGP
ncbi:hypothetical protein B0J13DRAFT_663134 [Dactylonectria estremocensis]|uniref:Uncharacterized protein n=1 Tax=Dactylonectria estremocensis TaxID=1079267 RepID=A0A9P9JAT9_9HYPO|nr:hypothetical protein B0J13DRAFT_663134 [Dactylonectria estremocensis]